MNKVELMNDSFLDKEMFIKPKIQKSVEVSPEKEKFESLDTLLNKIEPENKSKKTKPKNDKEGKAGEQEFNWQNGFPWDNEIENANKKIFGN